MAKHKLSEPPIGPGVRVSLLTPVLPNFLRTEGGSIVPIADVPDSALRAIGKNWTALLLLKARNARKRKETR